jgi:hypothetical protein
MKKNIITFLIFITLLLIILSKKAHAQSFSDYKSWVLQNETDFIVKSIITDTTMGIKKDSTYNCQIIESKSGWIFNVINNKGKSLPFNERDIYFKKYFVIKD